MIKILHLENLAADAEMVEEALDKAGLAYKKLVTHNKESFKRALHDFVPDIVLSDHSIPAVDSIEALSIVKKAGFEIPFILITSTVSEEFAVTVLKLGMDDYILKDNLSRLSTAIQHALNKYKALRVKQKAVTELLTTHERLLFHLENSPLGYVEWDNENKLITWSRKSEEIFGWTLEEYTEQSEAGFGHIYIDDRRWMAGVIEKLLNDGITSNTLQCRHYHKNGSVIWCEWFNSVLKGTEGQVITIMSLVLDITERKKSEQALTNNEFRLDNFLAEASEAALVVDANSGRILDYNNDALVLFKYTPKELLSKTPADLSPVFQPDGRRSEEKVFENIKKTTRGDLVIFQWMHCDSEGKDIFCEVRLNLLTGGKEPLIHASIFDISDRGLPEKSVVEEKIKKQQEITQAIITGQEQERTVLGQELHDNINQILATSKLYIDFTLSSKDVRKDLMKESRNLLVNAMEEIRKLSKSLLPPSLGDVSLECAIDELIANIGQVHQLLFVKKWEIADENALPDKLKLALFRIVQEQLNNILKYASASKVTIALKKQQDSLLLIVKDDGVGFDLASTKKGAGLRNINSRSNALNGEVAIHSKPGAGCELVVTFNM